MSDARPPDRGTIPKLGRVNEICQEWMVREDGAMAYRLQNQEISQHYSGNKQRNAMVREDYPRAKTEQQKEQELAEQAAAVYRRMLEEQEEIDKALAQKLAEKLEIEEKIKKDRKNLQALEDVQNQIVPPPVYRQFKPREKSIANFTEAPVQEVQNVERFDTFKNQEEADAELARMLQEQEGDPEVCILERDRLLAIEAQDKELAKVLQERERVKAKKAKERAKQRALAKKQQQKIQEAANSDILMPDDAYSVPADMIHSSPRMAPSMGPRRHVDEYEDNYSLPVDGLDPPMNSNHPVYKEEAPIRPSRLNIKQVCKPRYPDPDEAKHSNIAMAIDPTYVKESPSKNVSPRSTKSSPSSTCSSKEMDMVNAPPYMPIQGQKRTASLEKRRVRDGCKQQ